MRHLLLAGLLGLAGCNALSPDPGPDHVARVAEWLSGSFSSAEQAAAQPDDYFDIRLEVVPIWTDREDGPWLYVEQAAAAALERPYRQRVYHVVQTEEGPRSDVYTLPGDPLAYAGAWQEPARFDGITPDTLALYADRRRRLMEAFPEGTVALFPSAPVRARNGDVEYPFRQHSDLAYLTGFPEPETLAVLEKTADGVRYELLVRPSDPERETWEGRRLGVAAARYHPQVS